MESMNIAINHNNLGVSCLQKGRHEEALLELKKAAQFMHHTKQELQKRYLNTSHEPCHMCGQCETYQCASISTNNSLIRSTPLIMSFTEDSTASCTVESAIVLMNMALCYHLDSAQANTLPDATENALTLYQMAYSLGARAIGDEMAHNLILTSLNNLGQLYYEMGEFGKSRLYLQDLSTYVSFLNQRDSTGYLDEELLEITLNAMVLRNPNVCAGAA